MKKTLLIALLLIGFSAPHAHAAIAFSSFSAFAVGNTGASQSNTVNVSGTDTMLVVLINQNGFDNVDSVTYDGVALTLAGKKTRTLGSSTAYIYYRLMATGPGNQTLTVTESSNPNQVDIDVITYTGVSQTATPDFGFAQDVDTTLGGNFTATVNVSTANSWIVAMQISSGVGPTSSVNATLRSASYVKNSSEDSNAAVGSGNQTIGYGFGVGVNGTTIIAMAFAPTVAASAPTPITGLVRASWFL